MGLTILDVAIGLILVYLVLSLVGTAVTEMFAQAIGKRGSVLRTGIEALLGEQMANTFYKHRLIRNLSKGERNPSYIPASTFAQIVLELASTPADGVKPTSLREGITTFVSDRKDGDDEEKKDADVGQTLLTFVDESGGDRTRLNTFVERWFNDAMDRTSGWYRRWAQIVLLCTSVVLVVTLNANTVRMVRVLYETPAARDMLVTAAKARVEQEPKEGESAPSIPDQVRNDLGAIEPVLGWSRRDTESAPAEPSGLKYVLESLVGFLVTILAISMGAPFWFKALQQLLRVRAQVAGAEGGKAPEGVAAGAEGGGGGGQAGTVPLAPAAGEDMKKFQESFDPDATRHSHANAYWLGKLAELAYQDGPGFKTAVAGWGLECRYVSEGDTQAHVVASEDRMIVAFRGTETNPGDIATDAKFKPVKWNGPGEVHKGFLGALDDAWDEVVKAIGDLAKPGQFIWFTGHSLGGALAVLAAMRWTLEGRKPDVSGLYTIGQPRVGDKAFAAEFANKLGERTFRYINNRDVVPRVPMRAMGYADAGRVLYFDGSGRLHVDPALWFRIIDVAFIDPGKIKDSLKETVGDHSAVGYVECLRRAMLQAR